MAESKHGCRGGLFITGTGTGVGKTVVTAGLLRWLRGAGVDAVSMKPVQTGAVMEGASMCAPDFEAHCAAAGFKPPATERPLMTPYLYEPACSPHLAARLAGFAPELGHIVDCARTLLQSHAFLLVEGAGGVKVPLNDQHLMQDLIVELGFPVLVVAQAGLGSINHTLMTVEVLQHAGAQLAGILLNECAPERDRYILEDNLRVLTERCSVPVLGCVPWEDMADYVDFSQLPHMVSWLQNLVQSVP